MIDFDAVTFTYDAAVAPVLEDVDLHIDEGELCLVVGPTGTGKSTLLRMMNGLVPHFTGGVLNGRVRVAGRDTRDHRPRDLADVIGMVMQDPMSGFVTDMVEDELAYGMESLGLPGDVMRKRVEETLDLMGLAELRNRPLLSLSGGQRQRVAIGSVLTTHPRVLVLDEPTSALDPGAAEDVLAALQRLVHDLGLTVVLAEHRLERVVQYADRVVVLEADSAPADGEPADMMVDSPVAPPVVQLGRLAGWSPLPVSVRDARRMAGSLRSRLAEVPSGAPVELPGQVVLDCRDLRVSYGPVPALEGASLAVRRGAVTALMGRNGAGKSTLLKCAVGLLRAGGGTVTVDGEDPASWSGRQVLAHVGFVPQEPADLLCEESVAEECRAGDRDAELPAGTTAALLAELAPEIGAGQHPRDLSEGQRLCLVLSIVLAARPPLLLLDEPTRGLDYRSKARLVRILRGRAAGGTAVLMASHDVELVAEVADRVVMLADGQIVAEGPTADIVTASPIFAPQVAKVLAPERWLTVESVAQALVAG